MKDPTLQLIQPLDLFRLRFLVDAQLSPDGQQVLFALATTDEAHEAEQVHLWLVPAGGGSPRALTHGPSRNTEPCWSPDGQQIAFRSTRTGTPQLYTLALDGGEPQPLTRLEQGVSGGGAWSPDGQWIAFTAVAPERRRDPARPYRLTRQIPRMDGMGFLDRAVQDLYLVAATGGEPRRLTWDATHNMAPTWSPDSQQLAFAAALHPETVQSHAQLKVLNLAGKGRDLTEGWGFVEHPSSIAWTPDGKALLFVGQPHGQPQGSKFDLWRIPAEGGTPQNRTASLAVGVGGYIQPDMPGNLMRNPRVVVTADGQHALVQATVGGRTEVVCVALRGPRRCTAILQGERSVVPLALAGAHLLCAESTLHNPADLLVSAPDGSRERRLTELNGPLLAERAPLTVTPLRARGEDGVEVEGWFLAPPVGEAPFPTVLCLHGGPHAGWGQMFAFDFQMLAGAGYGVLLVNQRGSTGYGDAFATAIIGAWGTHDYEDAMAMVDEAVARGLADEARLGVMGLSAGGFLAAWIVGQNHRFKAAVPENPVINWVSFFGTSDIGPRFAREELGGLPHEIPEVYRRCSPITYAHRCRTPTLLIQGEADHRCPPEQAEQFYRVLQSVGCPVEMLRLPDASHLGTIRGTPPSRHAQNEALLDWFKRWLD